MGIAALFWALEDKSGARKAKKMPHIITED